MKKVRCMNTFWVVNGEKYCAYVLDVEKILCIVGVEKILCIVDVEWERGRCSQGQVGDDHHLVRVDKTYLRIFHFAQIFGVIFLNIY